MARGNRESCEREVGRQKPESGALLADQLESHVHDQLAIVLVDAAEQRPQAVEETRVFTLAAPVVALQLNPLGEGRRFGRRFAVVEQLVERNFESSSQLFERLDGGNSVAVFHARNVAALQSSALFDVALREVFLFPYSAQAIGDNHDVPTYSATCISLQTNLIVTGRIWLAPKKGQTGWPKKAASLRPGIAHCSKGKSDLNSSPGKSCLNDTQSELGAPSSLRATRPVSMAALTSRASICCWASCGKIAPWQSG